MKNNSKKYYEITKNSGPHGNIKEFLKLNILPTIAIDLGCGSGRDTVTLIKNGWDVLAVDKENVEQFILKQLNIEEKKKISFLNSTFGNMILPKSGLIVANFSLPFSKKECFEKVWSSIVDSIQENGYFVGNFFGKNDSWYKNKKDLVFLSEEEVKELFKGFEIIKFNEIEKDVETAMGEEKHWHIYDVIANKKI